MSKKNHTTEQECNSGKSLGLFATTHSGEYDYLPLSYQQERIWILSQLYPESAVWNMCSIKYMCGILDMTKLEAAITRLVKRHSILRSVIVESGGLPWLTIKKEMRPEISYSDLGDRNVACVAEAEHLLHKKVSQLFNLSIGPLLRFAVVRLSKSTYLMVLIIHHIISDDVSIRLIWNELSALYKGSDKECDQLPAMGMQYHDFSVCQRRIFNPKSLTRHNRFWAEEYNREIIKLSLPLDYHRSQRSECPAGTYRIVLSENLIKGIKGVSFRKRVSVFSVYLSALYVLFHKYSGQNDIVIGTAFDGRDRDRQLARMVGVFANTVAIRASVDPVQTLEEVLLYVNSKVIHAYEYQEYPFQWLVQSVSSERIASYSPLFRVAFNMLKRPSGSFEMGDACEADSAFPEFMAVHSQLDISVFLVDGQTESEFIVEYRADLFTEDTIKRMVAYLCAILKRFAGSEKNAVGNLPINEDVEHPTTQLVLDNGKQHVSKGECLHELFELQVEQHPDVVAVVSKNRHLTYRHLDRKANLLANYLCAQGVGQDCLVGLCVGDPVERIVCILGIMKAGGAYVPIDTSNPQQWLRYILNDSHVQVLITDRLMPGMGLHVLYLEKIWRQVLRGDGRSMGPTTTPDALAYVIYTSGSTGKPKGVMVSHRGVCNMVRSQIAECRVGRGSIVLNFADICFDASVSEIFMALGSGGTLVVEERNALLPGPPLVETVNDYGVTHLTLPPSILSVLNHEAMPHVKNLIVAGEACPKKMIMKWLGSRRVWNAYGPTESSVCVTMGACAEENKCVHIGTSLPNIEINILDENYDPTPIGVPGELYIGGIGLARGYLGRPSLTAELFIPNPFGDACGERMYKSGDVARFLPGGQIEYIGRIDSQVKLRGYRIELGEIEAVLMEESGVDQAVVALREDTPGDKRLIAYVVAKEAGKLTRNGSVYQRLKKRLPVYMRPSAIVPLDAFPLTLSGKVDRSALPMPYSTGSEYKEHHTSRGTFIEETLTRIWAEVLGAKEFDLDDKFFEIGGNSLLLIQVHNKAQDAFKIEISLIDMFDYPSIRILAEYITRISNS